MKRGASKARLRALRKKYGLGEFKKSSRKRAKKRSAGVKRRIHTSRKRSYFLADPFWVGH